MVGRMRLSHEKQAWQSFLNDIARLRNKAVDPVILEEFIKALHGISQTCVDDLLFSHLAFNSDSVCVFCAAIDHAEAESATIFCNFDIFDNGLMDDFLRSQLAIAVELRLCSC